MLLVQKYLINKTFGDLERDHAVEISVDRRFGHKFSLNYNQITATDSDPLSQQCRGLILSTGSSLFERAERKDDRWDFSNICPGSTQILAYPMNRFFNYGQGAASIDWNDSQLKTFEKLDGTLCIVYFDHIIHEWHVATRSVSEADVPLTGSDLTFRKLFEKGLKNVSGLSFREFTATLDPEKTYCFELTSPYNRVVVNYPDTKITLIAVRHTQSHKEFLPELESYLSYLPIVQSFDLGTIEKVIDHVNAQNPMDHEGIVLRDSKFNRIKVKNAAYVAYNKARDSLANSPRACLEIVLSEKADDVIPFMPSEIAEDLQAMQRLLAKFLSDYQESYKKALDWSKERRANDPEVTGWNDAKLFAKCVQQLPVSWEGPSYAIYSGKSADVFDYIRKSKKLGTWSNSFLDNLLSLIGFEKNRQ